MSHPLREYLEVRASAGTDWIYCSKCQFQYCRSEENWREFCCVRLLPPSHAGHLMSLLDGRYLFRQLYCPSCAVLVDTEVIEKPAQGV